MTPYEKLQWHAETLGEGTHRVMCPWCTGGSKSEQSLSLGVSASGTLYFRCFRANCGKSGGKFIEANVTKKPPRYFTAECRFMETERQQWFVDKFGFCPTDTRYAPLMDRYIYTVRGPRGKGRGFIARSFSGAEPKVLTYNERPGEPFIAWALQPRTDLGPIVVVEDWVSAEKVSQVAIGVALNGTHMGMDAACEIAEHSLSRPVIFALDRDAFAKSVQYASKYGGMFKNRPRVWRLDKDLKYVPTDVIERAISDDNLNDFGDDWARSADRTGVH
jgi:hypothetical protein